MFYIIATLCNAGFFDIEPPEVKEASKYLKSLYKHTRYISDKNTWPPDQPKHFTDLAVVHCKDKLNKSETIKMTEAFTSGGSDSFFPIESIDKLMYTKHLQEKTKPGKAIAEIFAPFNECDLDESPATIVIEGAPGIGKTILSKEIGFQWANGALLLEKILVFLIFLIDPIVQNIVNLSDLIHYFYQFDESCLPISKSCAEYLIRSEGRNVLFILDGYDELSVRSRTSALYGYSQHAKTDFIYNLIHRKVLPESTLVITSRPHALDHISYNANRHIIILGFTEEERYDFVKCYLKNQSEKVSVVLAYLHGHSTINSLCCIPFNINVLLYLYRQGLALPKNSTDLYNFFLCNTIYCHLTKHKINCPKYFDDLNTIPQPFNQIVRNLASFALTTVLHKQLTFTCEEMKAVCPQVDEVPGALNGFGLLHTVGYSRQSLTFSFIHLSIQEYLAAYHIACLQQQEELKVLQRIFNELVRFDIELLNVIKMYIGLTKGQRSAFKEILEDSKVQYYLSHNFFIYFFLHRILYEADDKNFCNMINKCFDGRIIHDIYLRIGACITCQVWPTLYHERYRVHTALLPSDVENLIHFLAHQEPKQKVGKSFV